MRKVDWLKEVLDGLTQLWLQSDSNLRKAITRACHALEKRLAHRSYSLAIADPSNGR